MKVELRKKTVQFIIAALEDENSNLLRMVSGYKDKLDENIIAKNNLAYHSGDMRREIDALKLSVLEKDAEIAILKEEKKAFIQSLSAPKPTP